MRKVLIYCLFVGNIVCALIFSMLLSYKYWQENSIYTYIESFYENKDKALIHDIERNNCQRLIMFYKVYNDSINSAISQQIAGTCKNTAYYKDYLFYENIEENNLTEAMKIYNEILEKKDYKLAQKEYEMLAKIKPNYMLNKIDYTVDKNFNEMLFIVINLENNIFISNQ